MNNLPVNNLPEVVITNDTELHHRIMQLKYLKEEQETTIKHNVREVVYSMRPAELFKKAVKNFSEDKEASSDLTSMAVNLGKDFFITKLFGRGGTLKGFLTSLLVKKATDYVVEKNPDLLVKGLEKLQGFLSNSKHHSNGNGSHEEAA